MIRLELEGLSYTRSLLGNQRADELLTLCAERLQRLVGVAQSPDLTPSRLVGRVSDGGFVIVRDDLGEEGTRQCAEMLKKEITCGYTLGGYEINATMRLGIATLNESPHSDAHSLFDQAEMAMAQLQSSLAFYSSRIRDQRRDRARLVNELRRAVSNGDLHVEYQPKVAADSCELKGVEALARWNHPSRGVIPPSDFIPLAEENGLILSVGEYVFEEACRQSRQWTHAGRQAVPIAINFSGHQFIQKGLLESHIATLDKHALGPEAIEIELTETIAVEHCDGIDQVLQKLHDLGVSIAIDDFGTGYSSLNSLHKYPFHTLKIDRSFIADLGHNPGVRSVIQGIIGMGHSLGMQIVAEGVEEVAQLNFLREQGCNLIQGFLTGRSMRAECIEPLLLAVGGKCLTEDLQ